MELRWELFTVLTPRGFRTGVAPGGMEPAYAGVSAARPLLSDSGTFQHVSPDDSSSQAESAA